MRYAGRVASPDRFINKVAVLYVLSRVVFSLLLFMLAILVVVGWLEAGDIALRLGSAYAVSVIWDVFGPGAYRELSNLLESRGYSHQPVGGGYYPGSVVVYGDVRPIAEEVMQYGGPITVYTRDFYFKPPWEPAEVEVASLAAAQLFAALASAALLAAAWYIFSRNLLRLPAAPLLLEVPRLASTGSFAELVIFLGTAAVPPVILAGGLLLSRLRRR